MCVQCASGALVAASAAAGLRGVAAAKLRSPRLRRWTLRVTLLAGLVAAATLPSP